MSSSEMNGDLRQRPVTKVPELLDQQQEAIEVAQELKDDERLITVLLYASLLFVTVLGGIGYALIHFDYFESITRARVPKQAQYLLDHPSYFADKRNILNQVFVKKGWFWTTLAFLLIQWAKPRRAQQAYYKPVARYVLATTYWILFTTWFFGPSFADRVLLWTGARCVPGDFIADQTLTTQGAEAHALDPVLCMAGGYELWQQTKSTQILGEGLQGLAPRGRPFFHSGHDVSGHTFLLVHASLFLVAELAPVVPLVFGSTKQRARIQAWQRYLMLSAFGLVGLWWFMLLMTSVYFHSPQEKISGFLVGSIGAIAGQYIVGT